MHATFEEIAANAMRLPPRDRVKLAQRLVSTLDPGVEKDVEGMWLVEAERRLEELRTGKAQGIDAPEAFRKAHEALKKVKTEFHPEAYEDMRESAPYHEERSPEIVDADLVALAEETITPVLATFNKKDFRRFPHLKQIP